MVALIIDPVLGEGMGKISTTKPDTARRQLDTAIRMLFSNEDPLAIYSVVGAADRIVRDLADKSGKSQYNETIRQMIRPGKESMFWKEMNKAFNFIKHAAADPTGVLDFEEEVNDITIYIACIYYETLGYQLTPFMLAFRIWYILLNPDLFDETAPVMDILSNATFDQYRSQPRIEQLKLGHQILCKVMAAKSNI